VVDPDRLSRILTRVVDDVKVIQAADTSDPGFVADLEKFAVQLGAWAKGTGTSRGDLRA
jgi:hypothetical protein